MWFTRFAAGTRGESSTLYHEGATPEGGQIETCACTFSAAHLVLQIVAFRAHRIRAVQPEKHFAAFRF
jgi:hypothetical protein